MMKKLILLRSIIQFVFVFACIAIAFSPAFIIMHFVSPGSVPDEVNIKAMGIDKANAGSFIVVVALFGGMCMYVYALYLFRKILDLFSKKKVFNDDVISNFSKCGKSILWGTLLLVVPPYLYHLFADGTLGFEFDLLIDGTLLILALGLFLMVLSEVFQMAKNIKEENDLTV